MPGTVQILPSQKIDREKWDATVAAADNGLIYSYYDYLDHLCDNWHGYIVDDYRAVMALPWRRKFGIRYIYQPAFIQQLGLIGDNSLKPSQIISFAKFGDLLLNFSNSHLANDIGAIARTNMVIDLSKGYDSIYGSYKKDLVLNLKKAGKEKLNIIAGTDIDPAVDRYRSFYHHRIDDLRDKDFSNFLRLARKLVDKKMCFTRKVTDKNGSLLAIGLFLKDNRRIYNLMNSTTDEGRAKEANHFLLDEVISEFAGEQLLFDFEGSDIPGVKNFYEKFGGTDQPYFYYHYNKLSALLRLFKK